MKHKWLVTWDKRDPLLLTPTRESVTPAGLLIIVSSDCKGKFELVEVLKLQSTFGLEGRLGNKVLEISYKINMLVSRIEITSFILILLTIHNHSKYLGVAPVFTMLDSRSFGFLDRPATDGAVDYHNMEVEFGI